MWKTYVIFWLSVGGLEMFWTYDIPNGENKINPKHQPAIFLWLKQS